MANENTVEVLQDGQLAIATVAQSGTIISGRGDETVVALVSTDEGNQLALKTVNVGEGGGSGSVPTLTWFTGKTGQSIDTDIATLPTSPLVKVYKNGGLLQQGEKGGDIWYVGGSGKNITSINPAPLTAASTWKFQTVVDWETTGSGSSPTVLGMKGISDNKAPALIKDGSTMGMYLSSNGSSWDIASASESSFVPQDGKIYEIEMGYDGEKYYLDAKEEGAANFTRYQSKTSSAKVYCSVPFMLLNTGYPGSYHNASAINLSKTKFIIDDEVWFDGSKEYIKRYTNPLLTANGTAGGDSYAAYASLESSPYYVWQAFDGDTTTSENCWYSGANPTFPVDLTYYYPQAVTVTSIDITNEVATPVSIKDAIIQGSNDGTNFDDLATIQNVSTYGETTNFPVSTTNKYKYIRLHILSSWPYSSEGEGVSVQEVTIHTAEGVDEATYTNNGCTLKIDGDYSVSGEDLLFSTALIATDKVCVETY